MKLSVITSPLAKSKLPLVLAGVAGVVGLVYVFKSLKSKKKAQKVLTTKTSELLPVKKQFTERAYNPEEKIFLRNPDILEEKLFRLKAAGVDELQIIVDFDQTITAFTYDNQPSHSCFSMIRHSSFATPEYIAKNQANVLKYMPIEQDPSIPRDEKIKYLEEWWSSAEAIIQELNLKRDQFAQIVDEAHVGIRHGFANFARVCDLGQLPIYVVSGGILDFIKPILNSVIDTSNEKVKMFGNVMEFDEQDKFVGFAKPHINSLHKETILNKQNTEAKFRKNAILIGDAITDRLMTSNLGLEITLSIGFLDPERKEQLQHFMEVFDIVILGDGNFTQIEALTREIIGLPQRAAVRNLVQASESPLKDFINFE